VTRDEVMQAVEKYMTTEQKSKVVFGPKNGGTEDWEV